MFTTDWETLFRHEMVRLREQEGFSQTGLAKELQSQGVPLFQQQIDRIEKGTRAPRLNEALAIARALNHDLEAMIGSGSDLSVSIEERERTLEHLFQKSRRLRNSLVDLAGAAQADGEVASAVQEALDGVWSENTRASEAATSARQLNRFFMTTAETLKSNAREIEQLRRDLREQNPLIQSWDEFPIK